MILSEDPWVYWINARNWTDPKKFILLQVEALCEFETILGSFSYTTKGSLTQTIIWV